FGPLLYLYVVALTRPVVRFDARWLIHGLPFVADVVYMAQVFYAKSGAEKLALAAAADAGRAPVSFYIVGFLAVALALVYLVLAWRVLGEYGRKIRGYFSDLARIDLRWLRALVLAHIGVWSIVLAGNVLWLSGHVPKVVGPAVAFCASLVIFLT